ncbi:MAG: hypothetical protein WA937_15520 [Flavobacteriales bacterium]
MFNQQFAKRNPFLYHLTASTNAPQIVRSGTLLSTASIARLAIQDAGQRKSFVQERRPEHVVLSGNGSSYSIRDQRPISMTVLDRSLTPGLRAGDFIELLNGRVFFWPTINRLRRHYDRYTLESPVILRVKSTALIELNPHVQLARLNTGATRCHPKYGGNAPTRGKGTFIPPDELDYSMAAIAEVTFPDYCRLPDTVWIARMPEGPWIETKIKS